MQWTAQNLIADGLSVKNLSLSDADGWRSAGLLSTGEPGVEDAINLYRTVPYMKRAVKLRAGAVSAMPYAVYRGGGSVDVSGQDTYKNLLGCLPELLNQIEGALCLYGAAYLIKESNRFGRNVTPRWVLPPTITPIYTPEEGLSSFTRVVGWGNEGAGQVRRYAPDEIVYIWLPDPTVEIGPGFADGRTCAPAATVLRNIELFTSQYFARGAIKAVLLQVQGNPPDSELRKLEAWWKRLISGVKNAWNSIAIRANVTPVVIGDGLTDMENEELLRAHRQNVCAAFGIPETILSANSANYATSLSDRLNFYEQTIIPECQLIESVLNEQLFVPLGLRLAFQPKKLEIKQSSELEKAQGLSTLTGKPIMAVSEAREMLDLDPKIPADEAPPQAADPTVPAAPRAGAAEGNSERVLLPVGGVENRIAALAARAKARAA